MGEANDKYIHEAETTIGRATLSHQSFCQYWRCLLPARASEQCNVIGLVSVYIYVTKKKIVVERTRDLIYLKFVATDFSPKIISPSTGENSGDSA